VIGELEVESKSHVSCVPRSSINRPIAPVRQWLPFVAVSMSEPPAELTTDEFDYDLPDDLIAQTPVEPRDSARLLVDAGRGAVQRSVEHRQVRDLPDVLRPGDLVVVNDSRVIPARLRLQRETGGAVEVLLLERLGHDTWDAMVRPGRKLRVGEVVTGAGPNPLRVEIGEVTDSGVRTVRIDAVDPMAALAEHGTMPLPPYITTPLSDPDRYQTVYAREPGSSAAPTAGLHLTDDVLARFLDVGIGLARVELRVGLDTFRPISGDRPDDHPMHTETFHVHPDVLDRCRETRAAGGRVVAIGTTTVRALESAAGGRSDRTDLFIRRGFDWKVVDVLLTNFHLPRTTLLCMIDAFCGPRWRDLYELAKRERYRFLSFGDAMLLTRSDRSR
jgi:S-adenosylmethionine:tRNA ribosyltransferase-isomerase